MKVIFRCKINQWVWINKFSFPELPQLAKTSGEYVHLENTIIVQVFRKSFPSWELPEDEWWELSDNIFFLSAAFISSSSNSSPKKEQQFRDHRPSGNLGVLWRYAVQLYFLSWSAALLFAKHKHHTFLFKPTPAQPASIVAKCVSSDAPSCPTAALLSLLLLQITCFFKVICARRFSGLLNFSIVSKSTTPVMWFGLPHHIYGHILIIF